jgi:hypothetical protein
MFYYASRYTNGATNARNGVKMAMWQITATRGNPANPSRTLSNATFREHPSEDHRSSPYLCCSAGEWTSTLSLDAHVTTTFIPPLTHHSQYLPRRLIRMGWPSGMNWALHFKSSALKILIYHAEESSSIRSLCEVLLGKACCTPR